MESYVTRREFENVLKEVQRLQYFLVDTFGAKFTEFFKDDKFVEAESRLKNDFGSFTTNMQVVPPPPPPPSLVSELPSHTVPKPTTSTSMEMNARKPVISARIALNEAATRGKYALNVVKDVAEVMLNSNQFMSSSSHATTLTAAAAPTLPISVARAIKRKKVSGRRDEHETVSPSSSPPLPPHMSCSLGEKVEENECMILDNDDTKTTEDISMSSYRANKEKDSSSSSRFMPKLSESGLPSLFRRRKITSRLYNSCGDEIMQCEKCQLYIYRSKMIEHLKTHSLLNINGNKSSEKPCSSSSTKNPPSINNTVHHESVSSPSSSSSSSIFQQPLTCFLCRKEFATFQLYEGHCNFRHTEGNPCPICFKVLSKTGKLRLHMKAHANPRYVCHLCGKCCNRHVSLENHLKTIHEGQMGDPKDFYCMFCDVRFDKKEERDEHLKTAHANLNQGVEDGDSSASHTSGVVGEHQAGQEHQAIVPQQTSSSSTTVGHEFGGSGSVFKAGELIDVSTQIKMDVSSAFQFEFEGDEDE